MNYCRSSRFGDGLVQAPSLGTLLVTGESKRGVPADFAADVRISGAGVLVGRNALGAVLVGGTVWDSSIEVDENVGSVRARAFVESSLLLGTNATTTPGLKLGAFVATGLADVTKPAFVDSLITADRIGKVSLKSVGTAHPHEAFGVTAGSALAA